MSSSNEPNEPPNSKSDGSPPSNPGDKSAGAPDDAAIEKIAAEVWGQPNPSQPAAEAIIDAEVVEAEAVETIDAKDVGADVVTAEVVTNFNAPPVSQALGANEDLQLETGIYADPVIPAAFNQLSMQTKGGAVGGVLLGLLSICGSWLTAYSIINAALGLMLSCWGLQSSARQWAAAGIALSLVGAILSMAFRQ